jgi:hypothetical protein
MTPTNDWQGGRVQILRLFHADGTASIEIVENVEPVSAYSMEAQQLIFHHATVLTSPDRRQLQ